MKKWRERKSGLRKVRLRRRTNENGAVVGASITDWKNDSCPWEISTDGKKLQEPIKINVGSKVNILIKFSSEIHYEAII